MSPWERARITAQLVRSLLRSFWPDTRYPSPVPGNPKFMSARDAAGLIRDGDVVGVSGLGGNQRAAIVYRAIRECFAETGHPAGLTVVNVGGHGGRGRVPGTLEELGQRGLCVRLITGHFETFRAMLDLAAQDHCELQCIPLGTLALLIEALGRGEEAIVSETGIDTFVDPRVGTGSCISGTGAPLITPYGSRLRYALPPIDVALFNAPAADREGNVYVKHCATIGESAELARAAKHGRRRGRVIVNVGLVVEKGYDRVFLPADMVDAVVYHPDTEQAAGIPHRSHWPALTTESDVPLAAALERAEYVNWLAGLTPRRSAVDDAVARLAAAALVAAVGPGAHVNIGTGLPERVCRCLFEAGLHEQLTLLVESGPIGGVPASGIYFGASFSPRRILSTAELFRICYERLDATCLGALEVDSDGNVNVSRRSEGLRDYVGPGGFIDLTTAARVIVFVSGWAVHGRMAIENGRVRITRSGMPKFVDRVQEITFHGARALAAGKRVFYATPVGLFRLTPRGMELANVMPGIDVRREILDAIPMRVVVPPSGSVPVVPREIVTGEGFRLVLGGERGVGLRS